MFFHELTHKSELLKENDFDFQITEVEFKCLTDGFNQNDDGVYDIDFGSSISDSLTIRLLGEQKHGSLLVFLLISCVKNFKVSISKNDQKYSVKCKKDSK